MLAAWGRFVHRHRVPVLVFSVLLLGVSAASLALGGDLTNNPPTDTESGHAFDDIRRQLPAASGSSFQLVFRGESAWDAPAFRSALDAALADVRADPRVSSVTTPYDAPPEVAATMVARDGRAVLAVVSVHDPYARAVAYYDELRAKVAAPSGYEVLGTGNLATNHDFDTILDSDLLRAEIVSLPLTLILLLLVFGTLVAATLPLGVGVLAVVGGLGGVFLIARTTDVAQYAVNVVTLIGLGVAIDYSLFVVNRFREEMAAGLGVEDALARTMATAGRAVVFSGVTVAIGLAGLLFFQGTFLASMGAAGTLVVTFAVVYALTFLPAILSLLGHRVDTGRVFRTRPRTGAGMWHAIARGVMRHPLLVLIPTLAVVGAAAAPFADIRLASADVDVLPAHAESRRGHEAIERDFPGRDLNTILVVARYADGAHLTATRVGALHDLSRDIARLPDVLRVQGIVDLDPSMQRADYQALWSAPPERWPPEAREVHGQTVGDTIVLLSVATSRDVASDEARALVDAIRAMALPDGEVLVTGATAVDMDTIAFILDRAPEAVAFVVLVTYVLLLLLVGSVFLPLKAILMNFLSISASFGALVWVFQEGHFHELLRFTPASIDPTLPIIMFCILFGLSMDYEVLMLSRMSEEWERLHDNQEAVAQGLEKTGRLVTGAAAIMVVVFGSFGLAEVTILKAIGLGLALAVLIDATLVRALIVPSTMRLMGGLNWWGPAWLKRFRVRPEG